MSLEFLRLLDPVLVKEKYVRGASKRRGLKQQVDVEGRCVRNPVERGTHRYAVQRPRFSKENYSEYRRNDGLSDD
jgi:hypothetical protein